MKCFWKIWAVVLPINVHDKQAVLHQFYSLPVLIWKLLSIFIIFQLCSYKYVSESNLLSWPVWQIRLKVVTIFCLEFLIPHFIFYNQLVIKFCIAGYKAVVHKNENMSIVIVFHFLSQLGPKTVEKFWKMLHAGHQKAQRPIVLK